MAYSAQFFPQSSCWKEIYQVQLDLTFNNCKTSREMQNARIPASDNRNRMTGIVVINPTSIKFRILNQYMTNANWFKIRIWGWLRDCRLAIFANWHKRMNETKFLMDFRWILLLFLNSFSIYSVRAVCLFSFWMTRQPMVSHQWTK